jgi:hypothetical protein
VGRFWGNGKHNLCIFGLFCIACNPVRLRCGVACLIRTIDYILSPVRVPQEVPFSLIGTSYLLPYCCVELKCLVARKDNLKRTSVFSDDCSMVWWEDEQIIAEGGACAAGAAAAVAAVAVAIFCQVRFILSGVDLLGGFS